MGVVIARPFLTADNPSLQDAVLHFITSVLTVDHPKFCKPLRMNILIIKVGIMCFLS